MIKAVIFDCFGVVISDGLKAVMDEFDKTEPGAREMINHYVRLANSGQIPVGEYGKEVSKRLNITVDEWRARITSGEHKNERVIEYIKSLRNKYKTAMLSNVPSMESMNRRFSDEELKELFDVVVISGEEGVQKPDLEIYRRTAEKLGVSPSECVFIDDIPAYANAATGVGMQAIWFQGFEQMKAELEALISSNANN